MHQQDRQIQQQIQQLVQQIEEQIDNQGEVKFRAVREVITSTTSELIPTITVNGKISTKLPSKSQLGWATAAAGDQS